MDFCLLSYLCENKVLFNIRYPSNNFANAVRQLREKGTQKIQYWYY